MDQFAELKNIILEELKKQYASTIITLWFDKMEIVEISGSEVILSFPSSRKLFVEANYSGVLAQTFASVLGVAVDVKFISPEEVKEKEAPPAEPEKQKNAYHTRFDPDYTFETFIVGKSNQLAQTAGAADDHGILASQIKQIHGKCSFTLSNQYLGRPTRRPLPME